MVLGVCLDVIEHDAAVLHADLVEDEIERLGVDGVEFDRRALLGVDAQTIDRALPVAQNLALLDGALARDAHDTQVGEVHEHGGEIVRIGLVPADEPGDDGGIRSLLRHVAPVLAIEAGLVLASVAQEQDDGDDEARHRDEKRDDEHEHVDEALCLRLALPGLLLLEHLRQAVTRLLLASRHAGRPARREGDAHLSEAALPHARHGKVHDAIRVEAYRAIEVAMPEGVGVLAADDALAGRHGKVHVGVHVLGIDIPIGADELPVQDAHVIVLRHGVRIGEVEDEGLLRVFGRRERIDRVLGHVDGIVPTRRTTRRAPGALEGYFDELRGDAVLVDDRDAVDDDHATGWRVEHRGGKRVAALERVRACVDDMQGAVGGDRRVDSVARALVALGGMNAHGHDAHAYDKPDCTRDDQRQDKTRRDSFVWFRDVRQIGQVRLSHLAS